MRPLCKFIGYGRVGVRDCCDVADCSCSNCKRQRRPCNRYAKEDESRSVHMKNLLNYPTFVRNLIMLRASYIHQVGNCIAVETHGNVRRCCGVTSHTPQRHESPVPCIRDNTKETQRQRRKSRCTPSPFYRNDYERFLFITRRYSRAFYDRCISNESGYCFATCKWLSIILLRNVNCSYMAPCGDMAFIWN